MREYLDIGSSPVDEPCAQLGTEEYLSRVRLELWAYRNQMERLWAVRLAEEPDMHFGVRANQHDFGTYHELVIHYDDEFETQANLAIEMQNESPATWDAEAVAWLRDHGYGKYEPADPRYRTKVG